MFFRTIKLLLLIFLSLPALAVVPGSFTYQGQIIKPNGQQLESSSVLFTVEIFSPGAEECLLYQETHTVNMEDSKGVFSLIVGAGSRSGADYEDTSSLINVFDNTLPLQTPTTCDSVGTFTPTSGDTRLVRITFDEGSGPITISQDHKVQSVPYAEYSSKLDGLDSSEFIQVNAGAGQELSQANIDTIFSTANHTELLSLLAGTSAQYMVSAPSAPPDFNNQVIDGVGAPVDGDDAVNKDYADNNIGGGAADDATIASLGAPETGYVLVWNGTEWTAGTPAADSTKLPLAGGTMTGAINMGNQDITNIKDVGINNDLAVGNDLTVTNNVSVTGGIGVNGINSGAAIQITNANELRLGDTDNSNYVGFVSPGVVGSNQIWTLPNADGSSGQVMSTNASGVLGWSNVALLDGVAGGQTFNGGLNANDDLTLDSTAHGTKGDVLIQPSGGNVGIGTASPADLFHIYGAASTTSKIESGGSATAQLALVNTDRIWSIGTRAGGNLHITDESAPGFRMTIDTSGNVGIGTTTPSGKLDVEGGDVFLGDAALTNTSADEDLKVKGNIEFDGALYGDGSNLTGIGAPALAANSVGTSELIDGSVSLIDMNGDSVNSAKIVDGSVSLADMNSDSVNSSKVVNNSLTTDDLGTDSVDSDEIAASAVGTSEIADLSVALGDMAANSVNASKIVDNSITVNDIGTNAVDSDEIAADAVGASEIATGAVGTLEIADGTVALGDMAANSVNAAKIVDNSITVNDIGTDAVDSDEIAADAVGASEIAAGAVGTSEIADGTVALGDLAGNSVNAAKIVDGSITAADLADDYVLDSGDNMTGTLTMDTRNEIRFADTAGGQYVGFRAPTTVASNVTYSWPDDDSSFSGYVLATDGSGNLTWNNPSAPADHLGNHTASQNILLNGFWLSNDGGNEGLQIDNSGNISFSGSLTGSGASLTGIGQAAIATDGVAAAEIAAGAVGTSEVADNSLTANDLAAGSVGTSEVADNSLTANDLAAGSVGTSEVADNSLTANDLAANSVAASEIAAGAVGTSEVADNTLTANDLAANSVGTSEVADNSLTASDLAAGSVGTSEVADNSLTASDLAAGSVGTSEIANGVITTTDISTASFDARYLRSNASDTMSGTLTATSFRSTSDRRLKKNIETLESGLDHILAMRGVRFDWKKDDQHEVGLIAQEVEEVYPALVSTDPKTGYKSVKYSQLVSPLIESTKDLYGMCRSSQEDIAIHDRRIASLQKQNQRMKAEIQSLKLENNGLKQKLNNMDQRLQALEAIMKGK